MKGGHKRKVNGNVKKKFNRSTTSRREGSLLTHHNFYNFIFSFPLNPFHQQQCCVRVQASNLEFTTSHPTTIPDEAVTGNERDRKQSKNKLQT
jgi:hypothetical protein